MAFEPASINDCKFQGKCSGCGWLGLPYDAQLARKRSEFSEKLRGAGLPRLEAEMVSPGTGRLRDRVDLTWKRLPSGKLLLGLYDQSHGTVVDLTACPALSVALESWLEVFRGNLPPFLEKGSVRLRVSPGGERGAWLDLANLDVKRLLEQREWLQWLTGLCTVEVGQRFKPLVADRNDELKLRGEPEPRAWFQTYLGPRLRPAPLFGAIGSFTQTGFEANRVLVQKFLELLKPVAPGRALELFSGLGNFTLPLASLGHKVTAFENDPVSVLAFEHALAAQPELKHRVELIQKNLYSRRSLPSLKGHEVLVVDPPRSGLRDVLDVIDETPAADRPSTLIYVSCFAESMVSDLGLLAGCGYRLTRLVGVDQFPQTPHCEWIARLER